MPHQYPTAENDRSNCHVLSKRTHHSPFMKLSESDSPVCTLGNRADMLENFEAESFEKLAA
jgi:hypothetical protein